jgi:hypothetical protein
MRKRTHFRIARLAINNIKPLYSDSEIKTTKRWAFYIGTILPDLSVNQFIHPHYYEKSSEYVFDKLNLIMQKPVKKISDVLVLGEMTHYLCDFCCFAHIGGSIGKASEHLIYERKIHKYLLKNQQSLVELISLNKYKLDSFHDRIDQVKDQLSYYKTKEPSYAWDIVNTIFITSNIYGALLDNMTGNRKSKIELALYDGNI